jgi:Putative peptidoglycan binding domain
MLDTAFNDQFVPGAAAYAAYIDGAIGSQPNYAYIVATFPQARHLSIALFAADDADCLDVEPGAASPSGVLGWVQRQHARGIARPCIYASVALMRDEIIPLIAPGAAAGWDLRLWTAHYGQGEHVCGPGTCGELPADADGTQWTDNAMGRVLDQSLLLDDFFGTPAPNWTETLMQSLPELRQGAAGTYVRTVQFQCGERGHSVNVDGSFGPVTGQAVREVQAAAGITADQVVGPQTWAALFGVS